MNDDPDVVKAWVLWWKYRDGSSCGVERVYCDEQRAREDHELISIDEGREWRLDETVLYGDYA